MNTVWLLMARFEKPSVPLDQVCEEFFGMKEKQARMLASAQSLPVPAFKLRDSEKARWFIDVRDLAEHIDKQRQAAKDNFLKVNSTGRLHG